MMLKLENSFNNKKLINIKFSTIAISFDISFILYNKKLQIKIAFN